MISDIAAKARDKSRRVAPIQHHSPAELIAKLGWLCVCVIAFQLPALPCHGQSLWAHRAPHLTNLYGDTGARRVGDLVTIVINETTDVANRDQRQLAKATDTSFNFDFAASGDVGAGAGAFDFQKNSDRNFDGQSNYSVAQEFSDQITVQVVDILPNGNMVIGGRRSRMVGGEMRTLVVSGVVRTNDVSPNNVVSSRHVANFKISYEGDGPESSYTNQGWAGRLVNKLWPF